MYASSISAGGSNAATPPPPSPTDPRTALQAFLFLDAVIRLTIWYAAFAQATAAVSAGGGWPTTPLIGGNLESAWNWSGVPATKVRDIPPGERSEV